MLGAWIFGFVAGVVVARCQFAAAWWRPQIPELAWLALLILALPVARLSARWPTYVGVVVMIVGLFWGIAHAAPPPQRPWSNAQVVATSTRFADRGSLLVKVSGGVYAVEGRQVLSRLAWVWPARKTRPQWFGIPYASAVMQGTLKTPVMVAAARQWINDRLEPLPARERGFLGAILLGDKRGLERDWQQAFFVTGLLHLLVVSGLHVSLVAQALTLVIAWPAQCFYAARRLSPAQWRHLQSALRLAAAIGAIGYAALVGMNAASHRSAFAYALLQTTSVFCGNAVLAKRLSLVFALQTVVYPLGLLCEATAMSWFAYLVVLEFPRDGNGMWRGALRGVWMQAKLIVGSGAFFGNLPLLGFVANPVFVPLFPLLLACGVSATAGVGVPFNLACVRTYADWVMLIASLGERFPACPTLPTLGLAVSRACTVLVWLNTCRRLSIRHYED